MQKANWPAIQRSDNGSAFISREFKDVLTGIRCTQRFSQPHNPRQNAMIERFNKTIKSMIYKFMTQWNVSKMDDVALQKLVANYNSTKHATTEVVPVDIHEPGADPISWP